MNRPLPAAWTLAILTGLNLFNYLDRYVLSAVLPGLQRDLGLSDGQAGRTATSFMIGYFVTSPFFGYLGDRISRKWLIASGILVWSLGTVLTGTAGGLGMLMACRVLVGVGEASYATIAPSYLADTFGPERRNNALTVYYVAIPVGAALGNIVGGLVAARYGWRPAFFWAGAPGLLLALVLLPFAEPKRGAAEGGTPAVKPAPGEGLRLFRIPDFTLVVAGYTAYTFALGAFGHWGPTFLSRIHGVPAATAGTFFGGVLVVSGLVATLLGGFAATAWRRRQRAGYAWTLVLSVVLATPVAWVALSASTRTVAMVGLAAAMFLLFLPTGPINTLVLESVPAHLRSSAMAGSIFCIHLFGDMWSPEVVGRLSDAWGSLQRAAQILPLALLVCAGFWLALALRQTRRPEAAAA